MARQAQQDPARVKVLEKSQVELNQLRYTIQQRPKELAGATGQLAREYIQRTMARLDGEGTPGTAGYKPGLMQQYAERRQELQNRIDLYRWMADRLHRDPDPDKGTNNNRLIEVLVALDLSDHGARFGPMHQGQFQRTSNISQIQDYRDWFDKAHRQYGELQAETQKDADAAKAGKSVERSADQQKELEQKKQNVGWYAQVADLLDIEPLNGAHLPQSWLCASMAIGSELCQGWGVPGFTFITLDDLRLRRDTPVDTLDHLDRGIIIAQLKAVRELMWHAWSDPKFKGQTEFKWQRTGFEGQVVSPAPGRPVPDLPREGFLATYYYLVTPPRTPPTLRWYIPYTMGIRRNEIHQCDAEGNYQFEGLPRLFEQEMELLGVQVYRVQPDTGNITACTDLGKQSGDIKQYVDIKQDNDPIRSLVFDCSEFSLVGLYDPRFLQDLNEVTLLDARRNADPQRWNLLVGRQMIAGFVEPDMSSYLVFRYGRVGNRLLLLNMAGEGQEKLEGVQQDETRVTATGFGVDQLNTLGPLSLITSKDFYALDDERLQKYAKAGVSNSLLNELHAQAKERMERAAVAYEADQGAEMTKDANGAWASEARVYQAAQDMANDVIRGTIFLLLLCVPFSFCMERLLVGTPNIYRQLTISFAIFAVMTAALFSFHPAFKISSSPLIVILAFAIIFMSVVVISVVYGKFDTELKRIRSGKGTPATTSFARASVLMSAVLLGIANMRKRRFRTALTSVTIVLITFAVLCFTSASRYLDTTTLPTGVPTNGNYGIMMRQRGFRTMSPMVLDTLQAVLPGKELAERWWDINAGDPKDMYHVVVAQKGAAPKIFNAQAVLGLSAAEAQVTPAINEVIGAEKFARIKTGEERIVFISRNIADQLGVSEGQTLNLCGMDLEVAGIFDANSFDQKMMTLSGEAIAPLKYTNGALDASGRRLDNNWEAEALDLDASSSASEAAGSSTYEHLSCTQFLVVPFEIAKMLPNSSLRSVAFKLKDEAEVRSYSNELAKRFAIAMYAGFTDGVRMVAASNLASVSGAGQVAVPLAIAGLIIFNTMMGSIAERRREIHVYTSLGLAPLHVGALFLAEAMTYGLIGTVFGYIIGQGVGTAMLKFGWLGSVTLNYSGTSAMMTMGLILIIVLLSALVPARLASKIAAPSIDRTWKVPMPKGDEIVANLPFSINKAAAEGALAYLADFFEAHQEGSIGKFSAGKLEVITVEDASKRASRGLKTVIWLTPFDLGVRQLLTLLIQPGQYEEIYEVQVVLERLSGDDGSWYRMNRSFLTELRKQFLQWRSLSPQRMLQYIEESRSLFAGATVADATAAGGGTPEATARVS
jgi:ABC-type lipoprotein release transport system permease subunit